MFSQQLKLVSHSKNHKNQKEKFSSMLRTFIRTKKTTTNNPSTQKVVNQLSALSASRKQPKLLKLSDEDLVKHNTIQNAWRLYSRRQETKRQQQLDKQHESIVNAMETLKQVNPKMFDIANKVDTSFYPLGMRVPTHYPPNEPWVYNYQK